MTHSRLAEFLPDKQFLETGGFESVYNELVDGLTSEPSSDDIADTLKWLERLLHHNVPDGKRFRGLLVPLSYQALVPICSKEEIKLASVLGWCLEMLQAATHIGEDIYYKRDSRRGRSCWYRVESMGTAAINDAFLIEHALYRILSKYFRGRSCYDDIIQLFLKNTYKALLGSSLYGTSRHKLDEYTMERYKLVVKYATSYYTYYLPLALAMAMAGVTDVSLRNKVAEIALEIGHLSQVRKDYYNCFRNDGRVIDTGRDIRDCKITWLFVTARENCSPVQLASLFENYGRGDSEGAVAIVKGLYAELDLAGKYKLYEAEMELRIEKMISKMEGEDELPQDLLRNLMEILKT